MKLSTLGFYVIAIGIVALDQAVKAWTRATLPVGGTIPLWKDVFELSHAQNQGMAFSLLEGQRWPLAGAAILVAGVIIVAQRRMADRTPLLLGLALAMPLGGAVGNLIDRLRFGFVTDLFYFKLINFPVFNVADAAITVGMALLFWHTLTVREPEPAAVVPPLPSNEPS
ncbi:MAG: signal peptidase II [Capsulimonadales bacterium]|nr:signal peptidase II [Capsulimonadales bacterium]